MLNNFGLRNFVATKKQRVRSSALTPLIFINPSRLLYVDNAKTTLATSSGNTVSVADNSGSAALSFAQTVASNKPTYSTTGGSSILFDGTDALTVNTGIITGLSHLFLFTVNINDLSVNNTLINMGRSTGNGRFSIILLSNGRVRVQIVNSSNVSVASADAIPSPLITANSLITVAVQVTNNRLSVSVNGLVVIENLTFNTAELPVISHIDIGAIIANGTTTTSSGLRGRIYAAEVYAI